MGGPLDTRLAILGAGPGGYAAAFLAADLGMEVTLIDPEADPGGVCLYRGCIPSKALLHAAALLHETRQAGQWGLEYDEPRIDLERLRAWKSEVVSKLVGGLGDLRDKRGVKHLRGRGRFVDGHTLSVKSDTGDEITLRFEDAIVATGSTPMVLPMFPADDPRVWNSTAALELPEIPSTLLVVGGGYIGLELGSVYAALGSRVTVVEMMPQLLPGVDAGLVKPLATRLGSDLEAIRLNTRVTAAEAAGDGIRVTLEEADGASAAETFAAVLVAVGRRPRSRDLGLSRTRVRLDAGGFIATDPSTRTAEPSIRAIGDVAGQPMLAHKASHEARVAVESLAGHAAVFEPAAIPAVVFTDPEIAWAGLTETQAREQNIPFKLARFPWAASGRAATLGRSDGVTRLLVDPDSQRILGVGITGPGAGELIAEGVLAIEMAATVTDLKLCIHPHPTLSETVMEAAEVFLGQSTHFYTPRRT